MDAINPRFKAKKKKDRSVDEYCKLIQSGNKLYLSELITMLESTIATKKSKGLDILSRLNRVEGRSQRIGITGSPGVGKSTFINAYACFLHNQGKKVAVLAIDPSSLPTKGSILGDKTRMADLTELEGVYIRPTPAGKMLGGVAMGTREAIEACDRSGYDVILIETVGVGQSEHLASQMVDITVLLLQMGAGDDIQGIKRGIIEMADIFIVNKDDGNHRELVRKSLSFYRQALTFIPPKFKTKYKRVLSCSSLNSIGFEEINSSILSIFAFLNEEDRLNHLRNEQDKVWLELMQKEYIIDHIQNSNRYKTLQNAMDLNNKSIISKFEEFKNKFGKAYPTD